MTKPQPPTLNKTEPVFSAGFYNAMIWIAGQLFLLALLVLAYGQFNFDVAWNAFMSINPAAADEALDVEKLKVLKVEAFRNFMLAVGAGGAVLGGLFGLAFAGVRTYALNSQAETAKKEAAQGERKHASEAFATAIEQLGNMESFAVRLGAVYALEALAKSSAELHGPIFETLCAFVREQAPAPVGDDLPAKIQARGDAPIFRVILEHLATVGKPNVVVQAILTVIGRRDPKRDPDGFRLDLQGTDLCQADLRKGHFENALLSQAYLTRADLREARFDGANLNAAHLEGAHLMKASLKFANIFWAYLEGADLTAAYLEGAHLTVAHLEGANLNAISFDSTTRVDGADLRKAKNIPAQATNDFRATVSSTEDTQWPDDNAPRAWDRDEDDEMPF